MKIVSVIICFTSLLLGKEAIGQTGFNQLYQSGSLSAAFKIINYNQNDYIVTSYFKDSISGEQGLDLKHLNALGLTLKRKRYFFTYSNFLAFFTNGFQIDISNSTILVTGASFNGTVSVVTFASINKNTLDTNWVRYYYDGVNNFRLSHILRTQMNEFCLFGDASTSLNNRPYAIKVDSSGNINSILDFTNLSNYSARQSCFDNLTQRIYFTGENQTVPQTPHCYVACSDLSGNIIWNRQIGSYPNTPFIFQIEKRNGYLLLCGQKWIKPGGNYDYYNLLLMKLNASNGDTIWHRGYGGELIQNFLGAFTINNDESITTTGCYQYASYDPLGINSNGVILKVKSNGDSLWMHTYSNYGVGPLEAFADIQPTPDGGYIVCGAPHYSDNCRSWVVKVDSMGIGPGLYTHPVDVSEYNIENCTIYPNPSRDLVIIEMNQDFGPVNILVNDILGSPVLTPTETCVGFKFKLNFQEIKPGIYFLRVYSRGQLLISKKIIKE